MIPLTTRLAPSPSGEMHAGTIFAALLSWLIGRSSGGEVVLRIEDLDRSRSRQEYADRLMEDYSILGLTWDRGPFYQNDRDDEYSAAYGILAESAGVYPCFCTRADLRSMAAPHEGEETVYDGRCSHLDGKAITSKTAELESLGRSPSMRLRVPDERISFVDIIQGECDFSIPRDCGDFVVRRSDGGFAYQLAVVVDDHAQKVNCVSRGYDLLTSTPKQMLLYELLGYSIPFFAHFPLFCAPDGRRLSKRDRDATLSAMVQKYGSPEAVLGHIAYKGRLSDADEPLRPEDLLESFTIDRMKREYEGVRSIIFE